jgi:ribosomal protein L20A (L18A)
MAMVRIREYNNKGLLTEYREPKESFHRVRTAFKRRWAIDRSA